MSVRLARRTGIMAAVFVLAGTGVLGSAQPSGAATAGKGTVGIYSDFTTTSGVTTALGYGWKLIADVAGTGPSDCDSPYTASSGASSAVASALQSYANNHASSVQPLYVSYWTVDAASGGASFYDVGDAAGHHAATLLYAQYENSGGITPEYTIADLEGHACGQSGGNDWASGITATQWANFASGWSDGVDSVGVRACDPTCMTVPITKPAIYSNQSQYSSKNLHADGLPTFVAVNPIRGNTPSVTGSNIRGYVAYYASCSNAAPDITAVKSWGGDYNSVQFPNSEVCNN